MTKALLDHIAELEKLVFSAALPRHEPGDYAEYLDEENPDAGVRVCRSDGTPIVIMPTDAWRKFAEGKR